MYKALNISPMIPSYDLKETASFFQNVFSFNIVMDGNYVILRKDDITIHILPAGDIGEMEFYLEVSDVDAVWDSIKNKVGDMKVKEPFDRAYGMREIHVVIPHTKTLMFVGQVKG